MSWTNQERTEFMKKSINLIDSWYIQNKLTNEESNVLSQLMKDIRETSESIGRVNEQERVKQVIEERIEELDSLPHPSRHTKAVELRGLLKDLLGGGRDA